MLLDFAPDGWLLVTLYLKAYIKTKLITKQRKLEGLAPLSDEEVLDIIWPEVESEFTKEEIEKYKVAVLRPGLIISTKILLEEIRNRILDRVRDDVIRAEQEEEA